jgi:hypothetical protein
MRAATWLTPSCKPRSIARRPGTKRGEDLAVGETRLAHATGSAGSGQFTLRPIYLGLVCVQAHTLRVLLSEYWAEARGPPLDQRPMIA